MYTSEYINYTLYFIDILLYFTVFYDFVYNKVVYVCLYVVMIFLIIDPRVRDK